MKFLIVSVVQFFLFSACFSTEDVSDSKSWSERQVSSVSSLHMSAVPPPAGSPGYAAPETRKYFSTQMESFVSQGASKEVEIAYGIAPVCGSPSIALRFSMKDREDLHHAFCQDASAASGEEVREEGQEAANRSQENILQDLSRRSDDEMPGFVYGITGRQISGISSSDSIHTIESSNASLGSDDREPSPSGRTPAPEDDISFLDRTNWADAASTNFSQECVPITNLKVMAVNRVRHSGDTEARVRIAEREALNTLPGEDSMDVVFGESFESGELKRTGVVSGASKALGTREMECLQEEEQPLVLIEETERPRSKSVKSIDEEREGLEADMECPLEEDLVRGEEFLKRQAFSIYSINRLPKLDKEQWLGKFNKTESQVAFTSSPRLWVCTQEVITRPWEERVLVENLYTTYDFSTLSYAGTSLGTYLDPLHKNLLQRVRNISNNVCGANSVNVASWNIQVLQADGYFGALPESISTSLFDFVSASRAHAPKEEGRLPGLCIPETNTKGSCKNILKTLSKRTHEGWALLQNDEGALIPSDADIPYLVKDPRRQEKITQSVKEMVVQVYPYFPETSVMLLKELTKQASREGAGREVVEELVEKLNDIDIARTYGHSEQVMGRFFNKIIWPEVESYHASLVRGGQESPFTEIWIHIASLNDCCWWCSRYLTSLSGPRRLESGEFINIRLFVTTGASFPILYCTEKKVENRDSRQKLNAAGERECTKCPNILFNYALPDEREKK